VLRNVFVYRLHDEFAQRRVHRFAQQPEQIGPGDQNQFFEVPVNATVFQTVCDLARELLRLLITRAVGISKRVPIAGSTGSVGRQITFVSARFGMNQRFDFLKRSFGSFDGEDAGTRSIGNDNPGLSHSSSPSVALSQHTA
jgi:hypothetical protein